MTESPTFQRISQETLEEHQQIHFYYDQLISFLDDLDEKTADVESLRQLAAQIASLRERLSEHFDSEQRGGLFQAVLEALPEAAAEVHRLGSEHDRMIEILEMAQIHAERGEPCEIGALRNDLREFLETMREHELAEDRMIKRVLQAESSIR